MLTPRQRKLLAFLIAETAANRSPSYVEMAAHLGLVSKSGMVPILAALEERGFIRRLRYRSRSIEILRTTDAADSREVLLHEALSRLVKACPYFNSTVFPEYAAAVAHARTTIALDDKRGQ
jgi:SOS-response transcriptional repressor LexA